MGFLEQGRTRSRVLFARKRHSRSRSVRTGRHIPATTCALLREMPEPTDRDLLRAAARGDAAAFARFYRRYVRVLLGFFPRRTGDPVVAADLAAETFAMVVERCAEPEGEDAAQWLFGIARRELQAARRRGAAERRARDRLVMAVIAIDDGDVARIERLVDEAIAGTPGLDALERLPAAQREAVRARILDERAYGEIAADLRCSGAVVRQRVSRGLRALARELGDV
jgi:RNA polymerase sigma factor (sigma-70 family)